MQPIFGRDRREITDWLAQGRYARCIGCRDTARAKSQGLPVDELDNVDKYRQFWMRLPSVTASLSDYLNARYIFSAVIGRS